MVTFPDIFVPSDPVGKVAPVLIEVAEAALEVDLAIDAVVKLVGDVVFTTAMLTVELVIFDGDTVMSNVLCVGETALLLLAHAENIADPFSLDA